MDLTLQSALSPEALIGHLAYVLLVASMLMARMAWLRALALASFATGVFYSAVILGDPVGTLWETLLAAVNIGQLVRMRLAERRARFRPEEAALVEQCFPGSPRQVQRALLDLGSWQSLPAGSVLARDGEPVPALVWLASGSVEVHRNGALIARREAGSLIGELGVAGGLPAHGDVRLSRDARVWQVPADRVRRALQTRPEQAVAFQAAFFAAMRAKLTEG